MRYKDRNFSRYQEKQRDGNDLEIWQRQSERKISRERNQRLFNFYMSRLASHFEKEWWQALEIKEKEYIHISYYNQVEMMKQEPGMWSNYESFETWEEWRQHILETQKPNTAKLRELRVKKLGL